MDLIFVDYMIIQRIHFLYKLLSSDLSVYEKKCIGLWKYMASMHKMYMATRNDTIVSVIETPTQHSMRHAFVALIKY